MATAIHSTTTAMATLPLSKGSNNGHNSALSPLTDMDTEMDAFLNYEPSNTTQGGCQDASSLMNFFPRSEPPPATATSAGPRDLNDEFQTPAVPSYDYTSFKQQSGVMPISDFNTGLNESMIMMGQGAGYMQGGGFNMPTMGSGIGMDFGFGLPINSNTGLVGSVNPSLITPQDGQNFNRPFPGIHRQFAQANAVAIQQQQAQRAQQMSQQRQEQDMMQQQHHQQQQQQQQQQRRESSRRESGFSQTGLDPQETVINRVLNQFRQEQDDQLGPLSSESQYMSSSSFQMKKDEEDMDEDERFLNSEEGKLLSAAERRQLRNKISARNFRSRRKQMISNLENANNKLKNENAALMTELTQSRAFINTIIKHPGFGQVVEELSRDPSFIGVLGGNGQGQPGTGNRNPMQPQQRQQSLSRQTPLSGFHAGNSVPSTPMMFGSQASSQSMDAGQFEDDKFQFDDAAFGGGS